MVRSCDQRTASPNARPSPTAARTVRGRWCVLIATSRTPARASASSVKCSSGRFSTGSAGFARRSVKGRMRVPSPAARTIALTARFPSEDHVAAAALRAEEVGIGGGDVVGGGTPERPGRAIDRVRAALDLHEDPDRRLVDDDLDLVPLPDLAVLLVAECGREAEGGQDLFGGVRVGDVHLRLGPRLV